jgi:hypothetical protein
MDSECQHRLQIPPDSTSIVFTSFCLQPSKRNEVQVFNFFKHFLSDFLFEKGSLCIQAYTEPNHINAGHKHTFMFGAQEFRLV